MTRLSILIVALTCLPGLWATRAAPVAASTPLLVVQGEKFGFVGADGQLLTPPRYACCGRWNEGRLWVQERVGADAPGTFLDEQAQPLSPLIFRDLAAVQPERPWPAYARGVAVVGLADGGFGYLNTAGRLLARTSAAGAFQQQTGDLLLCVDAGRVGFVDRTGNNRIPTRFAEATPFRGGRAAAREAGPWGLLDEAGRWVAAPAYDELRWFADEPRFWSYRRNARWGLLDQNGKRLTGAIFDDLRSLGSNAICVQVHARWGLAAADGALLLPPRYAGLKPFGKEPALWAAQSDAGLWGVVSTNGKEIVACAFDDVAAPASGLWLAQQAGLWGLLDRESGQWLTPARYSRVLPLPEAFGALAIAEQGGLWGVIETDSGRERLPLRFSRIQPWHRWLAAQEGATLHLLDAKGLSVRSWKGTPDGLPETERLSEGVGMLRMAKGTTLITPEGTLPWPEPFEQAGEWAEERLPVRQAGRWGFVDRQGKWVIEPRFQAARAFSGGVAPVCEAGRWGLIGQDGAYTVKPRFEALGQPWHGRVPAAVKGRWGLIDTNGVEVLPCVYNGIEWGMDSDGTSLFHGFDPARLPSLKVYGR